MKNNTYERQIYDFIVEYQARERYPPTISEIAAHIGGSTGNTWRYLNILRARGLIDWQRKKPRTIRVIGPFK